MSLSSRKFSQLGFTLPMVLIFVLAFIAVPLVFWLSRANDQTVQGAESGSPKDGTYIQITSKSGSWDLFEYLCKTKSECQSSLDSGKKWEATSGGSTAGNNIKINYSDLWSDYGFIKLYVKPSWNSQARAFSLKSELNIEGAEVRTFDGTSALIVPIETLTTGGYNFLVFSDE